MRLVVNVTSVFTLNTNEFHAKANEDGTWCITAPLVLVDKDHIEYYSTIEMPRVELEMKILKTTDNDKLYSIKVWNKEDE